MGNPRFRFAPAGAVIALVAGAGLTGCPTVDLGDTPDDITRCNPPGGQAYFEAQIWPNFVRPTNMTNGCTRGNACHNEGGGQNLNFRTQPLDNRLNYNASLIFLNCGTPGASPMLTKPQSGIDQHGGGDIFPANDPAIQLFVDWFK